MQRIEKQDHYIRWGDYFSLTSKPQGGILALPHEMEHLRIV